jgi:hypothetical protein
MYPTPSSPFALGSRLLQNYNIDFTVTVTLRIDPRKHSCKDDTSFVNMSAATGEQLWNRDADRDHCFPPLVSASWMPPSERRNSNCPLSGSLRLPASTKGFWLRPLQWHGTSNAILILQIQPRSVILLPSASGT